MNFKCKPKKLIKNKVFVTITVDENDGDIISSTTELSVSDFDDIFSEIKNMIAESKRDSKLNYRYGEHPYEIWLAKASDADGDDSKKSLFNLFDMQPRNSDEGTHGHSLEMVKEVYHDAAGMTWDVIIY